MGTGGYTFVTGNALFFIDFVYPVDKFNGVNGTDLGADAALITKVDTIMPRGGKEPFDPQQCLGRGDLFEIYNAAGQFADTAARAFLVIRY